MKRDEIIKTENKRSCGKSCEEDEPEYVLTNEQPLIRLSHVSKYYGKKLVLGNTNLEIMPGDIFGIVGMSGSGKTTLMQLCIGFIKPTKGDVEYLITEKRGKLVSSYKSVFKFFNNSRIKKMYGFSSQMPSFYEHLTVKENLSFYGTLYKVRSKILKERIQQVSEMVGLQGDMDALACNLSGGMQKRLDIGCSMIHDPQILFLDEPTADLDPILRKQMWRLIKDIAKKGTTVILSSHLLDEIESLCSKIAILHNQRILGYGTLKELKELFSKNQEIHLQTLPGNYENIKKNLVKNGIKIPKIEEKYDKIILFVSDAQKVLPKVINAIEKSNERIVTLDVQEATLNEIFELLTSQM